MTTLLAILAWWKEILGAAVSLFVYIFITNMKNRNKYLETREIEHETLEDIQLKLKILDEIADKRKEEINKTDDLNIFNNGA